MACGLNYGTRYELNQNTWSRGSHSHKLHRHSNHETGEGELIAILELDRQQSENRHQKWRTENQAGSHRKTLNAALKKSSKKTNFFTSSSTQTKWSAKSVINGPPNETIPSDLGIQTNSATRKPTSRIVSSNERNQKNRKLQNLLWNRSGRRGWGNEGAEVGGRGVGGGESGRGKGETCIWFRQSGVALKRAVRTAILKWGRTFNTLDTSIPL